MRLLLRHIWLFGIAVVLMITGTVALAYYFASLPTHLKIAVGPLDGDDWRAVEAIANQLKRERSTFRLNMMVVGGSVEASKAVDRGDADLAVVRSDLGMPKDGAAVAILRKNVVVIFVPPAQSEPVKEKTPSKTKSSAKAKATKKSKAANEDKDDQDDKMRVADLAGKRVGVIGRGQANVDLLKVIVRQYGISPEKVVTLDTDDISKQTTPPDGITVIHFDPKDISAAISKHKVDAIMAVGPVSSTIISSAIAAATRGKDGPTFISIGAAEAIAQRHPIYEAVEIKAWALGGAPPKPEDDIDTVSFSHYIVARRALNDQTMGDFARVLFSIRQSLLAEFTPDKNEIASTLKIEAPSTDKDAPVAVHPGAAAYFTGDQKNFFDRYGDYLFYGFMLSTFCGTAVTGLVGFSKVDERMRRLKALEHLLNLIKEARHAETIAALDQLQADTDQILAEMIHEVENDALDASALMAFSVSLDQAQMAISTRRSELTPKAVKA